VAHEHPPLDFPLFGLNATWHGPRWLDFLEGQAGDPVVGAWLGHGDDNRRHNASNWAFVGTFSRTRVEAGGWLGSDETFEQYLARRTALVVDDRPLLDRLLAAPDGWESWDAVTFSLGTRTLSARKWVHAGAQAVLSFDLSGLGLMVHSRGLGGADLSLDEVSDFRRYHFDPTCPLLYPAVIENSVEAATGISGCPEQESHGQAVVEDAAPDDEYCCDQRESRDQYCRPSKGGFPAARGIESAPGQEKDEADLARECQPPADIEPIAAVEDGLSYRADPNGHDVLTE
jgi:hypothetical protein